jgi:hypothetical protein
MTKLLALTFILFASSFARAADAPEPPLARFEHSLERILAPGLTRSQPAITVGEYQFISKLSNQPGLTRLVYLNKYGEVRWAKDPKKITETYDQFSKEAKPPTDAIRLSVIKNTTIVLPTKEHLIHNAVVVRSPDGGLLGVVSFLADGETLESLAAFAESFKAPAGGAHAVTAGFVDEDHVRQSQQHCLSGVVYYQNRDTKKAHAEWNLAVKLNPNNRDAWDWLGLK